MLCESTDLCNPVGCASAMLGINRGLNDTIEHMPTNIVKNYANPRRLSAIKKRQANQSKTFVKRKNTKLDNDGSKLPEILVPNAMSNAVHFPVNAASALAAYSSNNAALSQRQNMFTSQERRRSLMASHFGSINTLQTEQSLLPRTDLQNPRSVVFRSSSTACISPVRKTEDFPSPPTYFKSSSRINSPDGPVPSFDDNSLIRSIYYPNETEDETTPRRRSKSFGNRESLAKSLSLPKGDSLQYSLYDISANNQSNFFGDSHSKLGSESSTNSNSSGSGYNNNQTQSNNILVDSTNIPSERVKKKLKAARSKLRGSKSLSKSLHSLFPLGCTGSLTLHHDLPATSSDCVDSAIYQPLQDFETGYPIPDINQSPLMSPEPESNSKALYKSTTMKVLKTYTRRKSQEHQLVKQCKSQPVIGHPMSHDDHIFNNNNNNNTLFEANKNSSKLSKFKRKSLNKSSLSSCVATKDLWYNKLAHVIAEEKESSFPSTNIQVSYYDQTTNADICKTVNITSNTNARECISIILDHLEMRDADVSKFQLWVKTPSDDAPYPLIGHEFPLAIKYNSIRENTNENDSRQTVESTTKFILRQDKKVVLDSALPPVNGAKKVSKKARKSPIRIHKVFKRSNSKGDTVDGPAPSGILFGHPLSKLYDNNNGALPKPVMEMLTQLFQKGPFTVGIFRKSANARQVREMKEKLDTGCPTDFASTNITAVAALIKDYLRSLPDALLCSQLYDEWLEIPRLSSVREQIGKTLLLCSRLHKANLYLLQHFFCILYHISRRSSSNMMSASNLAVCVGPSLLWPSTPIVAFTTENSKQTPSVMEFLIERFGEIFGDAMLRLMGDAPETDPTRQDSGAEESDSLHSGHSLHSCNGRRDDSSIDSLERDLLEGELSPLPRKDKMSLTNLSRDSGLTMSDTQLYTPDEEESESTSSGHSSGDKNMGYPSDRVQHYPAPNNPNAIYTAICRRSEKSSPTYEEHESYYATPSREHTRVHITYSTPSYPSVGAIPPVGGYPGPDGGQGGRMSYEEDSIYSMPSPDGGANCHFQRGDWMRKKSNLRKVAKTNSNESNSGGLTRSTSEESLLNKYNTHEYGVSLGAGGATQGRRSPSADRIKSPAPAECSDEPSFLRDSAIRRSRSAHYLAEIRKEKLKDKSHDMPPSKLRSTSQEAMAWLRSKSTPHIHDEGDRSYDSSTLSDDDSTPHVSRSNSRGKETNCWDTTTPNDSSNSRNSSFKSERTSSVCTVISAGSCSTISSIPPSYEEALNRKSLMQQQQYNDSTIREEKIKSAKAKELYENSLRIYHENGVYGDIVRASPAHTHDSDEVDCPPPLPPKGDPPPLPPKQKSNLRRTPNESSGRLKHLPPVHVETDSPRTHKTKSTDKAPVHKTIIYTNMNSPYNINNKQKTVIEVVNNSKNEESLLSTPVERKSIETQTDEYHFDEDDYLSDEDVLTDDMTQAPASWLTKSHVTSVHVPDSTSHKARRRGRARRRDSSASQRSHSVPSRNESGAVGLQSEDSESEDCDEWEKFRQEGSSYKFRNLDSSELRDEISWSVSQLRAIFGDSLKGAKVHPPPYRPPPAATGRAPITSYHLGAGDAFCRKSNGPPRRESSSGNSYGEESYV